MTFQERFVVAIKDGQGRVLREVPGAGDKRDTVLLPFGAEYSVFLKNLGTTRAVVVVKIDGKDTLDGNSLVIDPGTDFDLQGFMEKDTVRYRFKTAQKTKEVVEHRGDSVEDGLVQVTFAFEELILAPKITYRSALPVHRRVVTETWEESDCRLYSNDTEAPGVQEYSLCCAAGGDTVNANFVSQVQPLQDEVVTVAGSEVHQQLNRTTVGVLGQRHTIVLKLRGLVGESPVSAAVTTRTKTTCPVCGTKSKSGVNFCPKCGNNLSASLPR